MERHLDEELDELNAKILKMATLTETAIINSLEALRTQNETLSKQVISSDKVINELENEIEEMAIEILALFQPMARDLRFITTGMRINFELERIADLASNIAYRAQELAGQKLLEPINDIIKLSDVARKMLKGTIDSFVRRDKDLATKVIKSDIESNQLRNKIMTDLIENHMEKNTAVAKQAVSLMLAARDLERICDHATNISEDIVYMTEAKVVKHHPERLER